MTLLLPNAGWTWWVRPRAIYCGTRAYVGAVRDDGNYGFDVIASDGSTRRITLTSNVQGPPADDHNNPAIVAVAGKPLLVFYSKHNNDRFIYLHKMPWNGDQDPVEALVPAQTSFGWGTVVGPTNNFVQPLADPANNTIHLFSTVSNRYQAYARSENWGTDFSAQPTTAQTHWIDFGSTFTGGIASFGFCYYRQLDSDPTKVRAFCAAGYESGRAVRYCEINLTTGDITKSDGTVLGNLRTGANLPLSGKDVDSPLEKVFQTPAGFCANYAYDVLGGTNPEAVFAQQDLTNPDTNSSYYWAQRIGGSWSVEKICDAGPRFTNSASIGYLAGAQFLGSGSVVTGRATSGGYVGTLWEGNWQLERWDRASPGNWTRTILATDPQFPLCRAYPVEGTGALDVVYTRMKQWVQYDNWSGELLVI